MPSARPQPAAVAEPAPSPLACIQPGGGLFFAIEAGWDRLRRRWLRLARPGYVRRMLALRQGDCPGCPHDIIDPRDLKLWRNACGFWFRPEDDRFRWRDRLPLARAGLTEVVVVSLVALALLAPLVATRDLRWLALAAVIAFLWFEMLWFFRDPEREIPDDPAALVSPADGLITHLEEVDSADFPGGRAFRISMWLSPLDVHLNRMPRAGRVVALRYLPGRFVNARREDAARINEQLWMDLVEPGGRRVRVIQISGALARRLVCWARLGEELGAGERYGLIKYGSRCDILLPAAEPRELTVAIGDKVNAGRSILLRFTKAHGETSGN